MKATYKFRYCAPYLPRRKLPMAAFQALLGIAMQKSHITQKNFVEPVSKG